MNGRRFDAKTRLLSPTAGRRSILRVLIELTGIAGSLAHPHTSSAETCRHVGEECHKHAPCCGKALCPGLVGTCGCPLEYLVCDGLCIAPQTNRQHCGACSASCAEGEICRHGVCSQVNGEPNLDAC